MARREQGLYHGENFRLDRQAQKYPSVEVLIKLCNYFNVSSDYLLGLSDEKEIKKYDLTEEQMELVTKMIIQFHQLNNK